MNAQIRKIALYVALIIAAMALIKNRYPSPAFLQALAVLGLALQHF